MSSNRQTLHRPASLAEAAAWLGRRDTRAAALEVSLRPVDLAQLEADQLLDLRGLGLERVEAVGAFLELGAQAPVQMLIDGPLSATLAGGLLAEAARLAAPLTLRQIATVGAAFAADDGPPELRLAWQVLDAVGEYDETGHLLVRVKVPAGPAAGGGAALARVARAPRDQAIVAAAACLQIDAGVARHVRLAIAGAEAQPRRCPAGEQALEGRALSAETLAALSAAASAQAAPVSDFRAAADYRRAMAGLLAVRAVQTAWERATVALHP